MTTTSPSSGSVALLLRLHEVQRKLEALRAERDDLIRSTNGEIGVRELSRFLGLSAAQVSRIRSRT